MVALRRTSGWRSPRPTSPGVRRRQCAALASHCGDRRTRQSKSLPIRTFPSRWPPGSAPISRARRRLPGLCRPPPLPGRFGSRRENPGWPPYRFPAHRTNWRMISSVEPRASPSAAKTFGVGAWTWGLTRTANILGSGINGPSWSPTPVIIRARGRRQARTSAPVAVAAARTRGSSTDNRAWSASNRKAAAASADPPPSPAAAGNRLTNRKRPSFTPEKCAASARAARNTRFSSIRARLDRPRTEDLENQIVAGLEPNPVAQPGKRHEALKFMIAIGPAPNHAQGQIDLRGRALPSHWA